MNHYVIRKDLNGRAFFVYTAPAPGFQSVLIGSTASEIEAQNFCRELNVLANQVDLSAERNLRLITRLQLLLADIDVERLVDNSSAAMIELLTKLSRGYESSKPEPGDDIYDSSHRLILECDHFACLADEARRLLEQIKNGEKDA